MDLQSDCRHGNSEFGYMKRGWGRVFLFGKSPLNASEDTCGSCHPVKTPSQDGSGIGMEDWDLGAYLQALFLSMTPGTAPRFMAKSKRLTHSCLGLNPRSNMGVSPAAMRHWSLPDWQVGNSPSSGHRTSICWHRDSRS